MSAVDQGRITIQTRGGGELPGRSSEIALSAEFLALYRIGEVLGAGAMGVVYSGTQVSTGRPVAIKLLLAPEDPRALARFIQEGRLLARLSHPAVLRVIDAGEADGHPYLVTDLLAGGNLRQRMESDGTFRLTTALPLALTLLEGLDAVHTAGIVHRDLKPDNVMFGDSNNPVIVDLGIGRLGEGVPGLTRTGAIVGTPIYMAPEQWSGQPATTASDLYAMGAILYEMLTGQRPFDGNSIADLYVKVMKTAPVRVDELVSVPRPLADLVERTLSKNPAERPASASALHAALRALISRPTQRPSGPVPPPRQTPPFRLTPVPSSTPRSPGRRPRWAAAALGVAVAIAAIRYSSARRTTPPPVSPGAPSTAASTAASAPAAMRPPWSPPPGLQLDRSRPLPEGAICRIGDAWLAQLAVRGVALSHSGSLLAVSTESMLWIWDRTIRRLVRSIPLDRPSASVSFSPDGEIVSVLHAEAGQLAFLSSRQTASTGSLSAWNVRTGERVRWTAEGEATPSARFHGRFALLPSGAGVTVVETGRPGARRVNLPSPADGVSISSDGSRLLARTGGHAWLFDVAGGRMIASLDVPGAGPTASATGYEEAALSPGGDRAVFTTPGGPVLMSLPGGQLVRSWKLAGCTEVTWSPDGARLAVALRPPETAGARCTAVIELAKGGVRELPVSPGTPSFSGDGAWLAVVPQGDKVRVCRVEGPCQQPVQSAVRAVSPTANQVLVCGGGPVRLVDLDSGETRPVTPPPVGPTHFSAFSSDLSLATLVGFDPKRPGQTEVALVEMRSARLLRRWDGGAAIAVHLSRDGSRAAVSSRTGLTLWDTTTGTLQERIDLRDDRGADVLMEPSFTLAALTRPLMPVITAPRQLPAYVARDQSVQLQIQRGRRIVAFSPDGRRAVLDRYESGPVEVREVPALTRRMDLAGSANARIRCVAWSPDGEWLAGSFADGGISLWNAADGALLRRFASPEGDANTMAVDRASGRLITVHTDGTALVWDLSKGQSTSRSPGPGSEPEASPSAR